MSGSEAYSIASMGLKFLRITSIVEPDGLFQISRSAWYKGVKEGRYPAPLKLGPRTSVWSTPSLQALLTEIEQKNYAGKRNG